MRGHLQSKRKSRLAAAAGLLVAIAAIAIVSVTGASARSSSGEISGAGATFPAPLIAVWQQKYEAAKGVKVNYNAIGSGGGIAAITQKTVDFGASDAPLTPDQFAPAAVVSSSRGCSRRHRSCTTCRSRTTCNDRARPGRHLPRQDQELERPPDQEHQPGRLYSRPGHHGRLPQRRQRHELQLHLVPEHGQQAVALRRRSRHDGQLADRRRRSRKLGCLGRRFPHDGRNRLRGRRIRPQEPPQVLLDQEPGRSVQAPGLGGDQGRLARRPEFQPDERAVDRQPSGRKEVPQGVPDLHVLLRPAAYPVREGVPAEAVRDLGVTTGGQYGPALVFQPFRPTCRARQGDAEEDPLVRLYTPRMSIRVETEFLAPPPSSGGAASAPGTSSSMSSRSRRLSCGVVLLGLDHAGAR